MPRNDISTTVNLGEMMVGYSEESTNEEIVEGILSLRKAGKKVSDNQSLWNLINLKLAENGKDLREFNNDWDKVIQFINGLEVGGSKFEENIALDSQKIKILLDEYDKYNQEKDLQKLAEKVRKNPLLEKTSIREVIKVLEEKRRLELGEEKINGGNKDKADRISDQKLITESRLKDQGIEESKAKKLAEIIVEKNKNETTINKQDVINKTDENNKETIKKALEIAQVVAYEEKVDKLISKTTEDLVNKISTDVSVDKKEVFLATKEKVREMVISGNFGKEEINKLGTDIAWRLRTNNDVAVIAAEESIKGLTVSLESNEQLVETVRKQNRFDEMWADTKVTNPKMTMEQEATARMFVKEVAELPSSGITQYREQAIISSGERRTVAEQNFDTLDTAIGMARSGQNKIDNLLGLRGKLDSLGIKLPLGNKKIRETDAVLSIAEKDPGFAKLMATVGKKIDGFNNFYNGLGYKVFAKVGGEKAVTWMATKIGGEAGKTIAVEGLKIVSAQGLKAGLTNIFGQIAGKIGISVVSGGTAAAGTTAATATGLLAGLSNPVGWAITAAIIVGGKLWDSIKKGWKGLEKIAEGLGLNPAKAKAELQDALGGFLGGAVYYGGGVMALLIGLPTLISAAAITSLVGPIIIFTFIGLMGYQLLIQGPQISSIKPPEGMGGGQCVLKSKQDELGGAINCNQNAPEISYPGLTKAKFVDLATRWHTGKNYAEECYNDVVNRALCAGVNPAWVLWVWVHESGASNYSIPDVEDFGIHVRTNAPPKDFNAQINYFLTLDMGAYCLNAPKIGGDYWLGLSTNFLNGGCDPDVVNAISGKTGRDYKNSLLSQIGWVSSQPMPNTIKIGVGGQNCGAGNEQTGTYDFKDQQGNNWVCTKDTTNGGGIVPNFEPWDPNTPVPEGCPDTLPIHAGVFTQGPFAPGCSHQSMTSPAIDIGVGLGTKIHATHDGVVSQNYDPIYGYFVDLHGTCNGKDFYTRYAHMPEGGYRTSNKATVKKGDVIGVVDTTGSSTGDHLHYHIYNLDTNSFGQYLGLSVDETKQLWACCNAENGKYCPTLR